MEARQEIRYNPTHTSPVKEKKEIPGWNKFLVNDFNHKTYFKGCVRQYFGAGSGTL